MEICRIVSRIKHLCNHRVKDRRVTTPSKTFIINPLSVEL
jgi:hypothetical protein